MGQNIDKKYVAEFKTTYNEDDCRVWMWGLLDCSTHNNYVSGTTIDSFMDNVKALGKGTEIYIHNLGFSGSFILSWLNDNGYTFSTNTKESKTYNSLISYYNNEYYNLKIKFNTKSSVTFIDSSKLIRESIEDMNKSFGLFMETKEIEYFKDREIDYVPEQDEEDSLHTNILILAKCLDKLFQLGLYKNTISSCAIDNYIKTEFENEKQFRYFFPELSDETDFNIRLAYRGGWCYANKNLLNKETEEGLVLDVNSLYSYVLYSCDMPIGQPVKFDGKYEYDEVYPLYVQQIICCLDLKDGHLPTIQDKYNVRMDSTEYITSTDGERVCMTLTNIDLEMLFEHYDVWDLEYLGGYKFKSRKGLFNNYIDRWMYIKEEATLNNEKGVRQISKLMLNGLGGKFGTDSEGAIRIPTFNNKGTLVLGDYRQNKVKTYYIPVAVFMTAYARQITISAAQSNIERFAYSDTDSVHLTGTEVPLNIRVSSTELGAWKIERVFKKAKFIRSKCYLEMTNEGLYACIAGLPSKFLESIEYDDFKKGSKYYYLNPIHVPGGIVLKESMFTIGAEGLY